MIKAIIIEDEPKAAEMLHIMLQKNRPEVIVLDKCSDLPAGVRSIHKNRPDLIFLDIEMPGYSGLQLLEFFNEEEVDFSIIFTTAFNDYAIKAFELSAIDYILKPIQIDKLNAAVDRYKKHQQKETTAAQKLALLKHNLFGKDKKIAVPVSSGVEVIKLNNILYFQADGSYTKLFLLQGKQMLVSKNLRYFEDLIGNDASFFRNHRSYLVNIEYIKKVLRSDGGIIQLENNEQIPIVSDKIDELLKLIQSQ
jgi:two-component system LytT family response regulator